MIELDPNRWPDHHGLGLVLIQKRDFDGARQSYKRALVLYVQWNEDDEWFHVECNEHNESVVDFIMKRDQKSKVKGGDDEGSDEDSPEVKKIKDEAEDEEEHDGEEEEEDEEVEAAEEEEEEEDEEERRPAWHESEPSTL